MANIKLNAGEIKNAEKLLSDYFRLHLDQHRLNLDTNEGIAEQEKFTDVLLHNSLPKDKDFLDFLKERVWAIHESLHTGLLGEITRNNTTEDLRIAFQKMIVAAPTASSAETAMWVSKPDHVGKSILSEMLCKIYPDQFSIQNKRSEWALSFILTSASPEFISEMKYDNFIDLCRQVWNLVEREYQARNFQYDLHRRLWYVDRFYLWVYERPETKQIMKALGYKD